MPTTRDLKPCFSPFLIQLMAGMCMCMGMCMCDASEISKESTSRAPMHSRYYRHFRLLYFRTYLLYINTIKETGRCSHCQLKCPLSATRLKITQFSPNSQSNPNEMITWRKTLKKKIKTRLTQKAGKEAAPDSATALKTRNTLVRIAAGFILTAVSKEFSFL